jgi:hypothetical protein
MNPTTRESFIYGRSVDAGNTIATLRKIDSLGNLYNLTFNPTYVRYKLYADSGMSWQAGLNGSLPVIVTVTRIYRTFVFGIYATVKAMRFEMQNPPPAPPLWLGTDHLGEDFGLVKTEIEPSDVYVLSGAIIDSVHYGTIVDVMERRVLPSSFQLHQNYPNPFNPLTVIRFDLPVGANVDLTIVDILGRRVRTLIDEYRAPGYYSVTFDGEGLASGVYVCRLKTKDQAFSNRMLLIR